MAPFLPAWSLVREARRRAGLTQAELADRAGTKQSVISMYERGRRLPDLDTLQRLVAACGLELRLSLAEPDQQREANTKAALARTIEERIESNSDYTRTISALRNG